MVTDTVLIKDLDEEKADIYLQYFRCYWEQVFKPTYRKRAQSVPYQNISFFIDDAVNTLPVVPLENHMISFDGRKLYWEKCDRLEILKKYVKSL